MNDPAAMIGLALALAVLIGLSLGMLGGGGAILTVPILTYVAGMDPRRAIASSLFVVAVTSAAGAVRYARTGRVRWPVGLGFGLAGMVGAFAGGRLAAAIPARALLAAFIAMMAITAIAMLRGRRAPAAAAPPPNAVARAIALGVAVGAFAGLVGAGGGFLIVPALVLFGGLPMPVAIGTSLVVIALQSAAGLAGHLGHVSLDWPVTLAVTGVAVAGSVVGGALGARIAPESLRRGFGAFVLAVAVAMALREAGLL